jgi:respiratory burst oxidase
MYIAIPVILYLRERMLRMIKSMVFDVKILNVCDG